MNKNDFERFLSETLSGFSREQQIEYLQKIPGWSKQKIDKLKKNQILCPKCHKYSKNSNVKIVFEEEIRTLSIYRDCGYGEDDTHGKVECIVKYSICPACEEKNEVCCDRIKVLNEFDRYGRQIK
ncbi:MAG: hypothetical protein PHP54_02150 [Clostridia bacterium]|nr:hypothetical protein [Clostridia bacterium]